MFDIAITAVADALRPKNEGAPVNVHVVPSVQERGPDFAAMNRVVRGEFPAGTVREPHGDTAGRKVSEKR